MTKQNIDTLTSSDILSNIGKNLRRIRENSGDSLEDAAGKIGMSKGMVANYESGKNEMGVMALIKFCANYNVSYIDILDTVFRVKEVYECIDYSMILREDKGARK